MNRKLLALLLTAAMLCTFILPQLVTPAVAGGWMDNYSYDVTTHTLTVFGMDDPSNYLENEWFWQQLPWFSIRKEVEKVILSDTVTQIPNYAFREFTAITSIDIPNGVTRIGRSAFFDCAELTSVTIPESVTSIGTYAFEFCHQLTEIRVDSKNAVYCNDSSGALLGNGKSELLFFPKNYCGAYSIPDGVTRIAADIFSGCTGLTSITVPQSITALDDYMFSGCSALATVSLPGSLTSIGDYAFSDCASLAGITIPQGVTSVGASAFSNCTGLTSVSIPDSVTSIGWGAFDGCAELTSITIPDGVTSIDGYVFAGCSALTVIAIPNGVTSISYAAFQECTGLTSITIPDSVTSIGDNAFYGCTGLTSITIPDNVTSIGERAFWGCTGLTSVTIPNSVTSIGYGAFYGCTGLTSIAIPDSVTSIGDSAFYGCTGLTNVTIPDSMTSIDSYTFNGCTGLTNVTIPDSVTSIGGGAFYGCTGLTSVTIPDSVTNIGSYAFRGCTGLTSITIPDSVTSIDDYAFADCTGLASITVSSGNKNYDSRNNCNGIIETATNKLISGCKNTDIPDSVTSIGDNAFCGCTGLTSITIPDSVTSIGIFTFTDCTGLTSVTIPNSVTSIGDFVFGGCTGLTSIIVEGDNPNYSSDVSGVLFNKEKTELICCPGGKTGSYTIPDSVTSIGNCAFEGCTGLTSIIVEGDNPNYSSDVSGVLFNKEKTELICCPGGKTGSYTIPDSVTSIGNCAFEGCTGLTSIIVEGDNPNYSSDVSGVLFNKEKTELICCPGGKTGSYTIPDSVTSIGNCAFEGCTGLTSIIVEGDNPNYSSDVSGVLFNKEKTELICCPGGKTGSYTIPDSVTSIGNCAFEGCTGLTSVCFLGDAPEIGYSVFQILDDESDAYINIPGLTLYYIEGKSGWTTPTWGEEEYPTAVWDGVNIPQPHTHSYTAVVTAPTCTEKGYTTYTCACGDSYKKDFVSALGHDFKDGTCTRCGASDPNYKPVDPTPEATFTDVSETAWYKNSVDYAVEHGLMNGTGTNTFEPESTMTRAMLVTVLWRYAGAPKPGANPFTDVPNGKWYTDAVAWAAENGVVNGVGDGKFEPDGSVTREQMATILYRYAQKTGIDTSKHTELSAFPDANRVSAYARAPMQWIVAEGVIGGSRENGQDWLNPQGNATRAEVATILMRFIENVAKRPQ